MLIISYFVTHVYHPKPIELCGRFKDLEDFNRSTKIEETRGWFVRKYEIIKQED